MTTAITSKDYSLTGSSAQQALERGLVSASWFQCPIPRKQLKELMQRRDGPAIRDTLMWIAAFLVFGGVAVFFWPSWFSLPFFLVYGVLYGSSSDSRWHECGHGTAFKTAWMNNAVYHAACFMIMREPAIWRWSHTRHHTDTIIVGRDPEIAVMRPVWMMKVALLFLGIPQVWAASKGLLRHAGGHLTEDEKTFVPEMERDKIYLVARIWLVIHLAVIGFSLWMGSILPMLLVGPLPSMYGAWLHVMTGLTQHGGLAEDVLDHRLNSRTVYMNPVLRFMYWNMNYHIEHHMFPMVPYHQLPKLHEAMKPWTCEPNHGIINAYREILPALWRQRTEPDYRIVPVLPEGPRPEKLAAE